MISQARTILAFTFLAALLSGCGQQSPKDRPTTTFSAQECQSSTQNDFIALLESSNSEAGRLAGASRDKIYQTQATCARFRHNWSDSACRIAPPVSSQPIDTDYRKVIRYCEEVERYVQSLNKVPSPNSTPMARFDNPRIKDLNRYDRVKLTFKQRVRNDDPEFGNRLARCYVDFDSRGLPEIFKDEQATIINVDLKRVDLEFIYDITAHLDARRKIFSVFCYSRTADLRLKELEGILAPIMSVKIHSQGQ